jgi:BirA family transcriptional regulator, biotin operon repressor / biotin---[acetyl-CoA-carboxylase] ligase
MSAADLVVDSLAAGALQRGTAGTIIGREVVVLEQTTSTNDAILQFAEAGATQGLVVLAEHQTAGRGQRGNRWESIAHKGLWLSILLSPKIELSESARLIAWAAETVAATIGSEFCLAATVKLPNDVCISRRKVAGVLVEMRARPKAQHFAIVGIGVNVNQSLNDFPDSLRSRAISLALTLGRTIDRQQFAVALLQNLDRTYCARFAL